MAWSNDALDPSFPIDQGDLDSNMTLMAYGFGPPIDLASISMTMPYSSKAGERAASWPVLDAQASLPYQFDPEAYPASLQGESRYAPVTGPTGHSYRCATNGSGPVEPQTRDQCPKCLLFTLQKLDAYPQGELPAGNKMEVLGRTPKHFLQENGRQCTWTLFRSTCRCSEALFWTYTLHPGSFTSTSSHQRKSSLAAKRPAESRSVAQARRKQRHSTYNFDCRNRASTSQSSLDTSFMSSSANPCIDLDRNRQLLDVQYATSSSSDDGAFSDFAEPSTTSLPNPPRSYYTGDLPQSPTITDHEQAMPTQRGDSELSSDAKPNGKKATRHIKDSWKYKFHHQYGACAPCRGKRAGCSPEHLDEETLRKIPDEVWLERPYPGWRPHWVPKSIPTSNPR